MEDEERVDEVKEVEGHSRSTQTLRANGEPAEEPESEDVEAHARQRHANY